MDYWEFLIQQDGDQTWLPLENQQVEILEGRYRVAVHTSLVDTPIDVRVSQLVLTEMPPRRRVRKRKGRTTDAGLLVIFPYMQLSPGRWEIHCSGTDVLDDFMGSGWERAVQLEVVPYEEDAWAPDWNADQREVRSEPTVANIDASDASANIDLEIAGGNVSGEGAGEDSGSIPGSVPRPQPTPSVAALVAQTAVPDGGDWSGDLSLALEVASDSTYGLQLERQALVAQPGRTVFLEGEIFSLAGEALPDSELSVQLRDPQTASVLMETRQHLPAQSLPAKLSVDLKLQTNLKTRVVLGAVSIRAKVASLEAALASASFTITAGLHDLLDVIANQTTVRFEEEISVYPGSTEPFTPPQPAPQTLIAPELPLFALINRRSAPAPGMTLPPQLDTDAAASATADAQSADAESADAQSADAQTAEGDRSPELPNFPRPSRGPQAAADVAAADGVADLAADPVANATEQGEADAAAPDAVPDTAEFAALYRQSHHTSADDDAAAVRPQEGVPAQFDSTLEDEDLDAELAAAVLTDDDDLEDDFDADVEAPLESLNPPGDEVSPEVTLSEGGEDAESSPLAQMAYVEQSFQSLNLQERFWDRLTALTYDGHHAAAKLRHEMAAAGVSAAAATPVLKPAPAPVPAPAAPTPVPATDEVVVYDDPPVVVPQAEPSVPPERAEPITLTPPKLDVPEQDLVAGELVSIRLRLKADQYRPYAKVWMNDRQTRKLVEDPRLVMHFTPNSFGELETLMRIKVPLGCLELQIAAIAVDMATLQESSRAVVNRHVVPPDLPAAGLDTF